MPPPNQVLLAAGAEVWWVTTWQSAVLPHAHLADIPELPVLELDQLVDPWEKFGWYTAHWKHFAIQRTFSDQPVCWVDDGARGHGATNPRPSDNFRVVVPSPRRGLTRREAAVVDRWVAWHRSPTPNRRVGSGSQETVMRKVRVPPREGLLARRFGVRLESAGLRALLDRLATERGPVDESLVQSITGRW